MCLAQASQVLAPALLAFGVFKYLSWRRRVKQLPPGPPKLPFIDNLFNMPDGLNWVKFAELGQEYNSDILHLSALGNSIIVLNTFEAAVDLLEKRSGIYSSRAAPTLLNGLSGGDELFAFAVYGDFWRASRRLFTKHFGLGSTTLNQPREIFYTRRFLSQLLDHPQDLRRYIAHLLGSISVSMTYGIKACAMNDPYIEAAEESVRATAQVAVGTYLVDVIPALRYLPNWFPGTTFKKTAEICLTTLHESRDGLFDAAKAAMEVGDYTPSFVSETLNDLENPEEPEFDNTLLSKNVAIQAYMAGADTTTSALATFFLLMTCYPNVQKKLQEELDRAIKGRLPDHMDLESLPYLEAVILEVFRWHTPAPVGIPHSGSQEDVYRNYYIPKDSIIVANLWAMHHDPKDYPEPFEFKPERFLKNGVIDESIRNPMDITFGFGRRICPGRHIAHSTMKMVIASTLLCFDILKKRDDHGNLIEPKQDYNFAIISHPEEFDCEIKPRSVEAQEMILAWVDAEGDSPP